MQGNKILISQIGIYNSQRVTDAQSKALFVARQRQFDIIMESISRTGEDEIPQHHLIIAQRGMGKTTLLKRIEVELRTGAFNTRYIPLLLPEEQYNVKSQSSFWLNCIDALADYMESQGDNQVVDETDTIVNNLMDIKDEDKRAKESFKYLKLIRAKTGKRVVLLIDNINMIFSRLKSKDDHALHIMRSLLCENGAPILIAASPVPVDDVIVYEAPFYDAFRVHVLERLTLSELTDIIINLANITDTKEISDSIDTHRPRIKALYQLAGGNPRTAVILFRLLSRGLSSDINTDLESLLDDLTPVFKGKLEELSDQMQVIVDAIAMAWEPVTLEQIRNVTGYENCQISPQLKRLSDIGWIEKPATRQGKGAAYELSERLFNIWFLMRMSSRRHKKSVLCLTKFMEVYYGEEIERIADQYIAKKFNSISEVTTALALAHRLHDSSRGGQLCSKSREYIFSHTDSEPDIMAQFDQSDLYLHYDKSELYDELLSHTQNKRYDDALFIINKMLGSADSDELRGRLYNLAATINMITGKGEEAISEARKAVMCCETNIGFKHTLAKALLSSPMHSEEARGLIEICLESEPDNVEFMVTYARYYSNNKYYDEVCTILRKAVELDPNNVQALYDLGKAYNFTEEPELAANMLGRAYELDQSYEIWTDYAFTLAISGHIERAKEILQNHIDQKNDQIYYLLSGIIANKEEKWAKSIEILESCMKGVFSSIASVFIVDSCIKTGDHNRILEIRELLSPEVIHKVGDYFALELKDFAKAEIMYKTGRKIDDGLVFEFELLRLYRDLMNDRKKALSIYNRLLKKSNTPPSIMLDHALFLIADGKIDIAHSKFNEYLASEGMNIDNIDLYDLVYFVAIAVRHNKGETISSWISESGMSKEFLTISYALDCLKTNDEESYLDQIPHEYRELTAELTAFIKSMMAL